jgi:ribosomal protein S18 acetylase RimI-like enzyme
MNDMAFYLKDVTAQDIETMRQIRNSCKKYMTRNSKEITIEQQKKWFDSLDSDQYKPFIFKTNENDLGYGMLYFENNEIFLTGGLLPYYRNLGYGKILFNCLIDKSNEYNKPVKLEVLKTNIRAVKTYESLGFKLYSENDVVYKMCLEQ